MIGQRLFRNTIINIFNTGISFVIAYAMTPVILHRLGIQDYGIWVFLSIFSVTGYFSLLDFGFQGASIKYIAEFRAANDHEKLSGVVSATLAFFIAVGVIGAVALWAFNVLWLPAVFHLPPEQIHLIQTLVTVIAVSFVFHFPALAYSAILEGYQRYDLLRATNIAVTILTNIAIFVWLTHQNGLPFLVGSMVASGVLLALVYGIQTRRILGDIPIRLRSIHRESWALLFKLSSKLFLSKLVGLVFNNTDKIVIGIFLTVVRQTDYDIVNKLHIILLSLLSIVNQAILPAAAELFARQDNHGLRDLVLRATKYSAALVFPIWLFFMILPSQAIMMWVGRSFTHLSPIVVLYCAHFIVTMFVGVSSTMMISIDKVGRVLRISLWAAFLNLAISLITVRTLGITGLILGTTISYLISSLMYIVATNKIFEIPLMRFWSDTIRPLIISGLGTTVVYLGIHFYWPGLHLISGLSVLLLGYMSFLALMWRWGITPDEKRLAALWLSRNNRIQPL